MDKLKVCPICGKELTVHGPEDWKPTFYDPDSGGDPYEAVCDCGFQFSIGQCEYDEFLKAVNRRTQPGNKPLTLKQLKSIGITPIWLKGNYTEGWAQFYAHIGNYYQFVFCGANEQPQDFAIDDYGSEWLAYARKLEQEEK